MADSGLHVLDSNRSRCTMMLDFFDGGLLGTKRMYTAYVYSDTEGPRPGTTIKVDR